MSRFEPLVSVVGGYIESWQRRLLADLDDLYLSITTEEGGLGGKASGADS